MNIRVITTVLILTTIAIYSTDAARGGFRGGGARGTRVRTGSSTSRVRSYRGPSYSRGSWQTAAALGTLYGVSSYQRRRLYRDNPYGEPTICFNEVELRNETFGYFICPEEGQADSLNDCCGEDHAQHCCDQKLTGAMIGGIVGGILVLIVVIVVIVCCCIQKKRSLASKRTAVPAQSWSSQQTTVSNPNPYTSPTPTSAPPEYSHIYSTPYSSGFPDQTDGQTPQNTTPIGFEGAGTPAGNPPPYSEKVQTSI